LLLAAVAQKQKTVEEVLQQETSKTFPSTTYLENHSECTSPAGYMAAPAQSPVWQPGTGNWVHRGEACSAVERTWMACRLDLMKHNISYSHRHTMATVLVTSQVDTSTCTKATPCPEKPDRLNRRL